MDIEQIRQDVRKNVGRKLKTLRRANGWSQRELAQKIGRSSNAVHTLETAKVGLSIDDLFLIAEVLGVSPLSILLDLLTPQDLREAWLSLAEEQARMEAAA